MKRGWDNNRLHFLRGAGRISPIDNYRYFISNEVLDFTNFVLREYGSINPSHEGLILWAGRKLDNRTIINSAIAPDTDSSATHIIVKPESMVQFITYLSKNNLIYMGQVHTHPGNWVGHSTGDNELSCFKRDGLLSFVVPNYGLQGILPLRKCGVHRFMDDNFTMLSQQYVNKRIKILRIDTKLIDLRNRKDRRWIESSGID